MKAWLLAFFVACSWSAFIMLMASGFRHPECPARTGTIAETGETVSYRCCVTRGSTYNVCSKVAP